MEQIEGAEAAQKSPVTTWLVKCTHAQKEVLQKNAADSGKAVAQFLVDSVQRSLLKDALSESDEETRKEFSEVDDLIERLNHLIYAKMYVLIEKQKKADELKVSLAQREEECASDYEKLQEALKKEFAEKQVKIMDKMIEEIEYEKKIYQSKLQKKESELIIALKNAETLEEKLEKIEREKEILQKQYTESMRSYEISDERLMECRLKIKEQEEKLRGFEATKEKNSSLEKELTILQMQLESFKNESALKMESLLKEETMKREYLEKDLRREHEIKLMKLNKEAH